jgi:hypothetical protein
VDEVKYECHITVHSKDGPAAEQVAKALHWNTSEIARDPVLGEDTYFYLTTHDDFLRRMHERMAQAAQALRQVGIFVVREKIEEIVHDVRHKPDGLPDDL